MPDGGLLGSLGETLGGGQAGALLSCYVRARHDNGGWSYTLVPYSTGGPIPAPIFFSGAAAGVAVSQSQGTVIAKVELAPSTVTLTVDVDIDLNEIANLKNPRAELVISPDEPVVGDPPPTRLSVIALPLTSPLPKHVRVKATLPRVPDGLTSTATVALKVEPKGRPVTAWLTDGPVIERTAYFGTSAGAGALPAELKSELGGLGIGLPLPNQPDPVLSLQEVKNTHTVETANASTGSRIDLDLSATAVVTDIGAVIGTPWAVPARPALVAIPQQPNPNAARHRYLAAVLRDPNDPDASESVPGATSQPIAAPDNTTVTVSTPAAPATGDFWRWRIYRQRLMPDGWWSRPVRVGDVPASSSHDDELPPAKDLPALEAQTPPPVPSYIDLQWGTAQTVVSPAPRPLPVVVTAYDETLPTPLDPHTTLALAQLKLPALGKATLRPNRGVETPFELSWDAAPTQLTVDYVQPARKLAVHLVVDQLPKVEATAALDVATLATVTWDASDPALVSGYAHLPPALWVDDLELSLPDAVSVAAHATAELRAGYPVDVLEAGWLASGLGQARARVTLVNRDGETTGVALAVADVPVSLAGVVVLPHTGDPQLPPAAGLIEGDGEVTIRVGRWDNAPALPQAATVSPVATPAGATALGRVLLRVRPETIPALPGPGPGPAIVAAVEQLAGGGSTVALRLDGLQSFTLERKAGETSAFDATAAVAAVAAARIVLTTIATEPVDVPVVKGGATQQRRSTVQVRARRFASPLAARLVLASVTRDEARYDEEDLDDRPPELSIEIDPASATIEGLAVAVTSGPVDAEPDSTLVARIDSAPPGASLDVLPVPGVGDPGQPERLSWRRSGGLRVGARVPGGGVLLTLAQRRSSGPPLVDVEAVLPEDVTLAVGGDVGSLGAGSGPGKVVPAGAGPELPVDWVGRSISWHRGRGTIAAVSGNELEIAAPHEGDPPDPTLPAVLAWYRVGDPADALGIRADAGAGTLRARVGAVTARNEPARLRAVTAGQKVRLEQLDDLTARTVDAETGEDRTGEVAAVAARVAARSLLVSGWKGDVADKRVLGELTRPDLTWKRPPELPLSWVQAGLQLDPARNNRSLHVAATATAPGDRRRDPARLQLVDTPDAASVLLGPSVVEIRADKAFGPGRFRAETAQWARTASAGEAGYSAAELKHVPTYVAMVTGWRRPELHDELDDSDWEETTKIGALDLRLWAPDVTRIVAGGGDLKLGRVAGVRWDSVGNEVEDPDTPWDGSGKWWWRLSDIWELTLSPNPGARAEALMHAPAEVLPDAGAGLQVTVRDGRLTARVLVVDLEQHAAEPGVRVIERINAWDRELISEIQMLEVEGSFAVGPTVGLDWDPFRPFQNDETTDPSWWWVASYKFIFGSALQFGSEGLGGQFDAPWDPYWS